MTTVAYKNGVMAADSCWSYNSTVDTLSRKIHRLKSGALLGQAGANDARELIAALELVKLPKNLPTVRELLQFRIDFLGIMVFPNGRVYKIATTHMLPEACDDDLGVWPVDRDFTAIGTGGEIAIGAMAAGKGALEAVKIACRFDTASRPPVYQFSLKPGT